MIRRNELAVICFSAFAIVMAFLLLYFLPIKHFDCMEEIDKVYGLSIDDRNCLEYYVKISKTNEPLNETYLSSCSFDLFYAYADYVECVNENERKKRETR